MEQLICHLIGDYILQSDWMANNKTNKTVACLAHCLTYTLPFLFLTFSPFALIVIFGTHFLIDRFRLAKYVVFAKNLMSPENPLVQKASENGNYCDDVVLKYSWENCKFTGYPVQTPSFLAVWLLIITDNALHLAINFLALKFF
jgi:hypothetical protein